MGDPIVEVTVPSPASTATSQAETTQKQDPINMAATVTGLIHVSGRVFNGPKKAADVLEELGALGTLLKPDTKVEYMGDDIVPPGAYEYRPRVIAQPAVPLPASPLVSGLTSGSLKRGTFISTLLPTTAGPDDYVLCPVIHEVRDRVYRKSFAFEDLGSSAATTVILKDLARIPDSTDVPAAQLASKIINYHLEHFQEYDDFDYDSDDPSHEWMADRPAVSDLIQLVDYGINVLKKEPALLKHRSPVTVLGDLHGNFKDLMHFVQTFGILQLEIATTKIQFLGDYVDRGPHGVETISFIVALKVRYPDKVFLLRGNHETTEVNYDFPHYGEGCFLAQCVMAYGQEAGAQLAVKFNTFFDHLPLAAVIDNKVFCVHGGLPRAMGATPDFNLLSRIEAMERPPKGPNDAFFFDLLWADPATEDDERRVIGKDPKFPPGFGPNQLRGGDTCIFGKRAVNQFYEQSGCTHIIRAHQFPKLGIQLSKGATTLTVFSSSHYDNNLAAAVLVYDHKLSFIIIDGAQYQPSHVTQHAVPPKATTSSTPSLPSDSNKS
ncbi:serine/threonine-protein phosphatase [Pelomyxa schiedti]|nr:serine/threonine-protein phosphatase [Pelomyxa schiedti]